MATGVRLKRSSDFRRAVHSTGARPPRPAAHRRSGRSAKTIARPCHGRRRQRKRWASACFYNAIGGRSARDDGFASDTQRQNNPTTFARQVTCCGLAVSLSRTETSGLSAPSPGGVKVSSGSRRDQAYPFETTPGSAMGQYRSRIVLSGNPQVEGLNNRPWLIASKHSTVPAQRLLPRVRDPELH